MKTQKIVLALALAAVTPAVLAAQDYVGGPGSKMSYIADNTLAKIRNNNSGNRQQTPVQKKQNDTTNIYATVPAYYPYGGSEGHMLVREDLGQQQNNKPQRTQQQQQQTNTPADTTNTPRRTTSTYNPYTGPDGHRYALGNAARDASQDSASVPTYVRDIDNLAKNNQVTLDSKQSDKSAKETNSTFRQYLREISQAIIQDAPYMK